MSTLNVAREKLKKGPAYPEFNPLDYQKSMRENLRFYNLEVDEDAKKAYAILYWENQGKNVKGLSRVDKGYFPTAGAVAHMAMSRGIVLEQHHNLWLDQKFIDLKAKIPPEQTILATKKIEVDFIPKVIGELEHALDTMDESISVESLLAIHNIKPTSAKRIIDWCNAKKAEFTTAMTSKDDYIRESYSHMSKKSFNKILAILDSISTSLAAYKHTTKIKVTKTRKAKPPAVLVKNIELVKEFDVGFMLKGIIPERIVGASEVWFYDTVKRRLIKYEAQVGMKLTVKGKTILNYDLDLSGSKIVRKPEILKDYATWTKRPAAAIMKNIKGAFTKLNGRIGSSLLLLAVF